MSMPLSRSCSRRACIAACACPRVQHTGSPVRKCRRPVAGLAHECGIAGPAIRRRRAFPGTDVPVPELPRLRGSLPLWRAVRAAGRGGSVSDRTAPAASGKTAPRAQGHARLDLFRHAQDGRRRTLDWPVPINGPPEGGPEIRGAEATGSLGFGENGASYPRQAAQAWQGTMDCFGARAGCFALQWLHHGYGIRRHEPRRLPGDGGKRGECRRSGMSGVLWRAASAQRHVRGCSRNGARQH